MIRRVRNRQRKQFGLQVLGLCVLAVATGLLLVEYQNRSSNTDLKYAGISCREVRENAEKFLKDQLSPEYKNQIAAHLDECPSCSKLVRSMKDKNSGGSELNHKPKSTTASLNSPQLIFSQLILSRWQLAELDSHF